MEVIKCKKKRKPPSEFEPKSPGKPHSHTYVLHQLIQVGLITSVRQYLISYSTPKLWVFEFNLCISDASSSYLFHCANIKCCWHEREPGNRVNRLKEMTPLRNEGSESCDPVQPQDGTQFNLRTGPSSTLGWIWRLPSAALPPANGRARPITGMPVACPLVILMSHVVTDEWIKIYYQLLH